jgi:hypothetical protein
MRHGRVLTAVAGILLALTACGEGGGEGDGGGSSPASKEAFEGQTPQQILDKAIAAAGGAKSVRMVGKFETDGEKFEIDLAISEAQSAGGTIAFEGESIEIRQIGETMYMKGGPFAELSPKLKNKWIKTKAGDEGAADFGQLTDMNKVFDEMLGDQKSMSRVDGKDVDGVPTVGLKDNAKSEGNTDDQGILYVAAEGEPYPLLVESVSGDGGLEFTDWNQPVEVKAPPKNQVVDQKDVAGELTG